MPLFLREFPNVANTLRDNNSWGVFYDRDNLNKDIFAMRSSAADQRSARDGLKGLITRTNTGQNLHDQYNEKQCHEALTYTDITGSSRKIFRVRKNDVRIYFIYHPSGKHITLVKVKSKREDGLTEREKNELRRLADEIIGYGGEYEKLSIEKN